MDRRILLALAFVLIAGGIYGLLTRKPDPSSPPSVVSGEQQQMFSVWAANRPLVKGEPVVQADLKPGVIDQTEAQVLGILDQERFSLVKGSLAARDMEAETILTEIDLIAPNHPDYVEMIVEPGMVPYPITFNEEHGYPFILSPGDLVDVVMISSLNQNLAKKDIVDKFQGLSVAPLLRARKVLKVGDGNRSVVDGEGNTTVVLELTRREVSQLMLARRVGVLDLHKSASEPLPQVRAGDVLPDFSSVTELRGIQKIVN